ncbi:uncharacterized protein MEPE_01573 [Melanopsichium pennsylvanicum]|uniref:Uncharacterized protein n=2 Tax=Melanopsichium pennsylvanicum TaxID=63383 RepID=A0AAJ4XI90_9BASI|nr:hypothetical protein BN887_01073 [Melanopsichium pennsylvanicum 4]SNX82867.1 uncharacterized protein MEPE_01573 [Melanopsichium pennsylvanicum]
MRFSTLYMAAALLALTVNSSAQLQADYSVAQPFLDRSLSDDSSLLSERSLLEARQDTNTTATTTSSAPESTASGSAPQGGDATITESTCSMTNHLSVNQQASWGNGFVNTCCGFATGTQCWFRRQEDVSGNDDCTIPSCADLESEDKVKMVGFSPLNSTNGSGKYGNIFLSLGMLSPANIMVPAIGLMGVIVMMAVMTNTMF